MELEHAAAVANRDGTRLRATVRQATAVTLDGRARVRPRSACAHGSVGGSGTAAARSVLRPQSATQSTASRSRQSSGGSRNSSGTGTMRGPGDKKHGRSRTVYTGSGGLLGDCRPHLDGERGKGVPGPGGYVGTWALDW